MTPFCQRRARWSKAAKEVRGEQPLSRSRERLDAEKTLPLGERKDPLTTRPMLGEDGPVQRLSR